MNWTTWRSGVPVKADISCDDDIHVAEGREAASTSPPGGDSVKVLGLHYLLYTSPKHVREVAIY